MDCLLSNQGYKIPGKFGPAYCSYRSRVTLISKPIHFIIYGGRHLISMEEPIFSLGYHNRWRHWLDPYAY